MPRGSLSIEPLGAAMSPLPGEKRAHERAGALRTTLHAVGVRSQR